MNCPHCASATTKEQIKKTSLGYRTFGSGSLEQDSPLSIVAVQKKEQASFVHDRRLGKGQRHADKTSQALT